MTEKDWQLAQEWQARYNAFFETLPDGFSAQMAPVIEELDLDAATILVRFSTSEKMANPMGTVHGGVVAGMADTAAGMLSKALIGAWPAGPTVSLSVNYLRPVVLGTTVYVKARCAKHGRFLNYANCEGYAAGFPEQTLFTGECVYFALSPGG